MVRVQNGVGESSKLPDGTKQYSIVGCRCRRVTEYRTVLNGTLPEGAGAYWCRSVLDDAERSSNVLCRKVAGQSLLGSAGGCQTVLNRTLQEDAVVEECRRDLEGAEQFLMVLSQRVPVQKSVRECRIELNDTLPKGSGAEWYLRASDNTQRCSAGRC